MKFQIKIEEKDYLFIVLIMRNNSIIQLGQTKF